MTVTQKTKLLDSLFDAYGRGAISFEQFRTEASKTVDAITKDVRAYEYDRMAAEDDAWEAYCDSLRDGDAKPSAGFVRGEAPF